jgi:ribonuclease J
VERILRDTPGLGVNLLTPENGERLQEVACAAERAGRLFVADPDSLAFAEAALGHPLNAPHALYNETLVAEISAHPGDFLLALPFERFAELLALNPRDGVVITSNGPPLGSFDPAYAHMQRWAERLGMQVADASSTGHAAPSDLAIVAALSGASTVMSIHSRFPELMPVPPERLLLPEPGRPHELGTLP